MKTLSKKYISDTATSITTFLDTATAVSSTAKMLLDEAIQLELNAESTDFSGVLAIANASVAIAIKTAEEQLTVPAGLLHYQQLMSVDTLKTVVKFFVAQAANKLNKASKLDGKKWALVQVRHTSKPEGANKYPWTGQFKLIQRATKARIANPAGNSVAGNNAHASSDNVADTTANKFKELSNVELIAAITAKSAAQQQAFFKALAEATLKISSDTIITALCGTVVAAKVVNQ